MQECQCGKELQKRVNPTDSLTALKKGAVIGSAYEVIAFQEEKMQSDVSCSNIGPNISLMNQEDHGELRTCCVLEQEQAEALTEQNIPEHLKQLYDASIEKLNAEQRQKLKKLLCDHQDVFAKHDLSRQSSTQLIPELRNQSSSA